LVPLLVVAIVAVAIVVSQLSGGSLQAPPRAGTAAELGIAFGYNPSRQSEFVAAATAGNAHPLFVKSPGGVAATASRVAAYRPLIDKVTAGTPIDPNLLEALVFVESAGQPQVIAGSDPTDAAGLTQILASTGQSLLGMKINLARSRQLTAQIEAVQSGRRRGSLQSLLARREAVDPRFYPPRELGATVRYLEQALGQFDREDLAFESYHMGIGNLHNVLSAYNGGDAVPYAQLYFDTAPDHHQAAYKLLTGFSDQSSTYLWRLLGAEQVMRLYRSDPAVLRRLAELQAGAGDNGLVLHPPSNTSSFPDAAALSRAYQRRTLAPLPANARQLGLLIDSGMGDSPDGAPRALYRGLRPVALKMLIAIAARVRTLAGGAEPLRLQTTVMDTQYQRRNETGFGTSNDGYSFQISRSYVSPTQALAFQSVLDRLQSLNLIAWARQPATIDVTVSGQAGSWLR
jgi:hypothetical protein